jgi:hypothetical protein
MLSVILLRMSQEDGRPSDHPWIAENFVVYRVTLDCRWRYPQSSVFPFKEGDPNQMIILSFRRVSAIIAFEQIVRYSWSPVRGWGRYSCHWRWPRRHTFESRTLPSENDGRSNFWDGGRTYASEIVTLIFCILVDLREFLWQIKGTIVDSYS